MTVSGVGELAASEMTRLPVTVTDSVDVLWARAAVGSAAKATPQASQCLIFKAMISPWKFYVNGFWPPIGSFLAA
jgi:hypothetical protein